MNKSQETTKTKAAAKKAGNPAPATKPVEIVEEFVVGPIEKLEDLTKQAAVQEEVKESKAVVEKKAEKPDTAAKKVEAPAPDVKEVKEVQTDEVKVKDPVMDFEIDPDKTYIFKTKTQAFRKIIPSTATVYDEVNRVPKAIVLTDTEDSPYQEDHSDGVKVSRKSLSFVKGELKLKGTNTPAIRYLLAYDGYEGKITILPGNRQIRGMYSLFIPEEEQANKLAFEKLKVKAKTLVLEASIEDVEGFITSIKNAVIEGDSARLAATALAETKPELVVNSFENPVLKTKAKLIKASAKGLIAVVNGQIVSATGKVLLVTQSNDALLDAAKEIASDTAKGKTFIDVLAEV